MNKQLTVVLIVRYADECCADRKFNSYFTSISQMPGNCQTLVFMVVETIPIFSLSLSVSSPTNPPFPLPLTVCFLDEKLLVPCVVCVGSH